MTATLQGNPTTESQAPPKRLRRSAAAVFMACVMIALAACGGSDDDGGSNIATASTNDTTSIESSESADTAESAAPAETVDLTPISDCIAAADIVVAPTTLSDNFLAEQGLAGALDLGAMGIEFGGGRLYIYQDAAGAEQKLAEWADLDRDSVARQEGVALVDYQSAVADEAIDAILACVG